MATLLDQDPFLLFELRGITREKLKRALSSTSLGKVLAADMKKGSDACPEPAEARFTVPSRTPAAKDTGLKDFCQGGNIPDAPQGPQNPDGPGIPALLIKKQGDYPSFWPRDNSFTSAMEAIYEQVRIKNKKSL